jgi:hypothetical protein
MCIGKRTNKAAGLIPVGMMFLVVGILWQNLFHPTTQSWKNWSDGLRGLMFGLSIGISLSAACLAGRQRRSVISAAAHKRDLQDADPQNTDL